VFAEPAAAGGGFERVRISVSTVFPQAIGMAATWNAPPQHQAADVIATEDRAKSQACTERVIIQFGFSLLFQ